MIKFQPNDYWQTTKQWSYPYMERGQTIVLTINTSIFNQIELHKGQAMVLKFQKPSRKREKEEERKNEGFINL